MYVGVVDPRFVVLSAPENVTVGPNERWPDLVVACAALPAARERFWKRSSTYRPAVTTVQYVHAAQEKALGKTVLSSLLTIWKTIGSSTGCAVVNGTCTENEDLLSYAVDSMLKVRHPPLYRRAGMLPLVL
jgi:hypothetical protein